MRLKKCSKCGVVKGSDCFSKHYRFKDGLQYNCKSCCKQIRREPENILKGRENAKRWGRTANGKESMRWRQVKRKYGLSKEEYEALFVQQNGACAICDASPNGKPLSVDHAHESTIVRGLLCAKCNTGLGNFGDSVKFLERAVVYLAASNLRKN